MQHVYFVIYEVEEETTLRFFMYSISNSSVHSRSLSTFSFSRVSSARRPHSSGRVPAAAAERRAQLRRAPEQAVHTPDRDARPARLQRLARRPAHHRAAQVGDVDAAAPAAAVRLPAHSDRERVAVPQEPVHVVRVEAAAFTRGVLDAVVPARGATQPPPRVLPARGVQQPHPVPVRRQREPCLRYHPQEVRAASNMTRHDTTLTTALKA